MIAMGGIGEECSSDKNKSKLAKEICSISTQHVKCAHRLLIKSHFIDWYRLLRVEEDADIEAIRKHYLKLALLLHPDKNKHPKAEFAFKLVSQAYTCLSDIAKRTAFDIERWRWFCIECNRIPYTTCNPPNNSFAAKLKGLNPIVDRSRSSKFLRGLKEIRERFKEEARVIENCLRANASSRKESPVFKPSDHLSRSYYHQHQQRTTGKESPLFNPSDHPFRGYPHVRTPVYTKPENLWYLQTQNNILNYEQRRLNYESPIFEINPEKMQFRSTTACLYI